MSKSDNKWVDKIRRELNGYSPEYNAADWAVLEKLLPVAKGWFGLPIAISNWIKGSLIVIIPAIAILTIYLYSTNLNLSENSISTDSKIVVENNFNKKCQDSVQIESNTTTSRQIVNSVSNNQINDQQFNQKNSNKKETVTRNIKTVSENKNTKESEFSISETTEIKNIQEQSNASVSSKKRNRITDETIKSDRKKQLKPNKDPTINTAGTATKQSQKNTMQNSDTSLSIQSENTVKINTNDKTNSPSTAISQNKNSKIAGKTIVETTAAKTSKAKQSGKKKKNSNRKKRRWKNNIIGKRNISRNKAKKPPVNKKQLPFFIGLSGSVNYFANPKPYNSKINFAGGIILEKFVTKNSSLSLAPEFFAGNYKYTGTISGDTTNNLNAGDTLLVAKSPTIENSSIEKMNTLKLLYLDFPVAFNYYFLNKKQYRLALFAGVSNKYILSIEKNGKKQQFSNKFYLAQSATFGVIYKREINKNLFFDIEPYVTIPLRKIKPENYSWTSFGVKVNLLFNVNRKK